ALLEKISRALSRRESGNRVSPLDADLFGGAGRHGGPRVGGVSAATARLDCRIVLGRQHGAYLPSRPPAGGAQAGEIDGLAKREIYFVRARLADAQGDRQIAAARRRPDSARDGTRQCGNREASGGD